MKLQPGVDVIVTDDTTEETRQRMEGYLAHKNGLADQLPQDHPYKDAPPVTTSSYEQHWKEVREHIRGKKCDEDGRKFVCKRDVGRVTGLEGADLEALMDWMLKTTRISHASGRWYAVTTLDALPQQALNGMNSYLRQKMREEGFARKILATDFRSHMADQVDAIVGAYINNVALSSQPTTVVGLAAAGVVSKSAALKSLGIDYGEEAKRMEEERQIQKGLGL